MKHLIPILALLLLSLHTIGQGCYPEGVTFMAQGEIDFFSQIYPDCKEIDGDVIIGPEISNLDGLLGITHINGSLTIENNPNLIDFSGLDSLTQINGSLIINENQNLTNFSGLDGLTRIELEFRVTNNSSITNFSGLEQLSFIGAKGSLGFSQDDRAVGTTSIAVSNNTNLINFVGLESLVEVGTIAIAENPNLINFDGFENLEEIDGMLFIWGNPMLENIDGLEDIERIGSGSHGWYFENASTNTTNVSIYIVGNGSLSSIGDLNNLKITDGSITVNGSSLEGEIFRSILEVGLHTETRWVSTVGTTQFVRRFSISGSPNLSLCANQSICNLLTNYSHTSFSNNGVGCSSNEEVFESCENVGAIYHLAYYDINQDGIYDEDEPLIEGVNFNIGPSDISITTNELTGSTYYLHPDAYTVALDTSSYPDWYLTTDSIAFSIVLDSINERDSIYVGLHPDNLEPNIYPFMYSVPFQCDEYTTFDIVANNDGNTVVSSGTLWIEADTNVLDVEFVDIPDTIISDYLYGWHFTNLYPGHKVEKNIRFHIPGPDNFEIGNSLDFNGKVVFIDNVGSDSVTKSYSQILDCDFEPNHKQVEPIYQGNFSVIGEDLFYTIQFQQTGGGITDRVKIEDQLDVNLDVSTFKVVNTSHPDLLTTSIDADNKVTFNFPGIFLPPAFVDFEESFGYVTYSIKAHSDIEEFTVVENFADLFFYRDIDAWLTTASTNTTKNIMVNSIDIASVAHPVFYDINEDGILDDGEPLLNGTNVIIEPGASYSITNQTTGGIAYLSPGTYTLRLDTSGIPDWYLTTEFYEYTLDIDSTSFTDTIYFGVHPNVFETDVNTVVFSQALRCNEFVTMDVLADNCGTTIVDGTLWLEIDTNIVDVEYIDIPDTIVEPYRFGWHFSELYPQQNIKKQISLKIPGPHEVLIGSQLMFNSEVIYTDQNGEGSDTYAYSEILECAYDPNDKLVGPYYPENYSLLDEELIYTIRFQNTGNAEAYNVEIIDQLDDNLDVRTFRLISSSHAEVLSTTIDSSNTVSFYFQNIFLPDSTTNLEESQGYVSYGIRAYSDIDEETVIENYADIYFDFNPPITTNTTGNVMLSTFDFDEDGFALWEDCDDANASINPDIEEIPDNGIDEDCDGSDLTTSVEEIAGQEINIYPNPVQDLLTIDQKGEVAIGFRIRLYDVTGKVMIEQVQNTTRQFIDLTLLENGIYFVELLDLGSGDWISKKIIKVKR